MATSDVDHQAKCLDEACDCIEWLLKSRILQLTSEINSDCLFDIS